MTFQEAHLRQRPTDKHSGVGLQGWSHPWAHVLGSAGSVLQPHEWRPELRATIPKRHQYPNERQLLTEHDGCGPQGAIRTHGISADGLQLRVSNWQPGVTPTP